MFDPETFENPEKASTYIYKAFHGDFDFPVHETMSQHVSRVDLVDMLTFDRAEFEKTISTSVKKKIKIESKWEMVKIWSICELNPSKRDISEISEATEVSFIEMASLSNKGKIDFKENRKIKDLKKGWFTYFRENDVILAKITPCMENGKCALAKNLTNNIGFWSSEFHVFWCQKDKILPEYLFSFLNREEIRKIAESNMTGASGHRRVPIEFYEKMDIPLPPLDIQQKIVDEMDVVERWEEEMKGKIENWRKNIIALFEDWLQENLTIYRLSDSDIFEVSIGKRLLKHEILLDGEVPVYSANVFEPFGYVNEYLITDFGVPSVLWWIDGDWMVNYMWEGMSFYPTDHCGVLRIRGKKLSEKYVAYVLEKEGKKVEFSRTKRASIEKIQGIKIALPPLSEQSRIVAEIDQIEAEIMALESELASIPVQKEVILKKYL